MLASAPAARLCSVACASSLAVARVGRCCCGAIGCGAGRRSARRLIACCSGGGSCAVSGAALAALAWSAALRRSVVVALRCLLRWRRRLLGGALASSRFASALAFAASCQGRRSARRLAAMVQGVCGAHTAGVAVFASAGSGRSGAARVGVGWRCSCARRRRCPALLGCRRSAIAGGGAAATMGRAGVSRVDFAFAGASGLSAASGAASRRFDFATCAVVFRRSPRRGDRQSSDPVSGARRRASRAAAAARKRRKRQAPRNP